MTTPRKRAPGGGRKRTIGGIRHTVTMSAVEWAHVEAQGKTRSEGLRAVVQRDMAAQAEPVST